MHTEIITAAMTHAREFDGPALEHALRQTIARHGLNALLEGVIPPLMQSIGDDWREGRLSVAHEHLASASVLAVLFDSMRSIPVKAAAPRLVVGTPEGEQHAIGAALAAVTAALAGWSVVYLGPNVPASDIAVAAWTGQARAVALSLVHSNDLHLTSHEMHDMRKQLPRSTTLIIGGAAATAMTGELKRSGLVVCDNLPGLRDALARITDGA
jgi:methanogenic corrinoid protein MtbC1